MADAANRSGLGSGAERCERITMREVSATRRNRMSPWKCTTKRQDKRPAFFVALPPFGGGFTVRAEALRFSSQGLSGKKHATGILFLTPSSGNVPQKVSTTCGLFLFISGRESCWIKADTRPDYVIQLLEYILLYTICDKKKAPESGAFPVVELLIGKITPGCKGSAGCR